MADDGMQGLRDAFHNSARLHLTALMTQTMLDVARSHGAMVPTPQLKKMCGMFAERCTDAVLGELSMIQANVTVSPDDLSAGLRGATTQEIIEHFAHPKLAVAMGRAMLSAGCAGTALAMRRAGMTVDFGAWVLAMSIPNSPAAMLQPGDSLDYEAASVHRPVGWPLGREEGSR